jgi:hypothetical protein
MKISEAANVDIVRGRGRIEGARYREDWLEAVFDWHIC